MQLNTDNDWIMFCSRNESEQPFTVWKRYKVQNGVVVDDLGISRYLGESFEEFSKKLLYDYSWQLISEDLKPKERDQELKADEGKLRMDLIPVSAYESLARVLTYGANKYGENKWQNVDEDRYIAALLRHFVEYLKDPQSVDEESGLKHIEHLLCNAMFLNDLGVED